MSRSVNKVVLLGHLGRDAETKYTQSGIGITQFSVATSRRWKDKTSGEWKEDTDWHNIEAWRMEKLADYLTKGSQVYVEGYLKNDSWEDKETGQTRYRVKVVAREIILLGGGQRHDGFSSTPSGGADIPINNNISDDDVPF